MPWIAYDNTGSTPFYNQIWCSFLQPYLKSGLNKSVAGGPIDSVDAKDVFKCPSFSASNEAKGMEQPDCDGAGSSIGVMPPTASYADYGMAFNDVCDSTDIGALNCSGVSGTQASPFFEFPGAGTNFYTGNFDTLSLSAVQEPAQVTNIADGWTGIETNNGGYETTFGCESQYDHQGGSNFCFLDGHAKYLKGNIQRYETKGPDGYYYMTYLSYSQNL